MVLHAAYKIDRGEDFKTEVSMAKHFVANALNRIIDRAIQVHGALGYSTDTPLADMFQHARWARFADGADEIHQMRIAERTIAAYKDHGTHQGRHRRPADLIHRYPTKAPRDLGAGARGARAAARRSRREMGGAGEGREAPRRSASSPSASASTRLLDPGSFHEIGGLTGRGTYDDDGDARRR